MPFRATLPSVHTNNIIQKRCENSEMLGFADAGTTNVFSVCPEERKQMNLFSRLFDVRPENQTKSTNVTRKPIISKSFNLLTKKRSVSLPITTAPIQPITIEQKPSQFTSSFEYPRGRRIGVSTPCQPLYPPLNSPADMLRSINEGFVNSSRKERQMFSSWCDRLCSCCGCSRLLQTPFTE